MDEPIDNCPLLQMRPIGYMESCFKYKNGTPRQPGLVSAAQGRLTIDRNLYSNPEHSLEGLEEFSHVWILFLFHKNNNVFTKAKIKPPRLNGRKVGVFSTRSPYRPNAVGLTLAKIECIQGASIQLSGIDLLDGTPVLDLKPYIAAYDQPQQASWCRFPMEQGVVRPAETDCHAGTDICCRSQQTENCPPDEGGDIQKGYTSLLPEEEDLCGCESLPVNTCDVVNTCGNTDVIENKCDVRSSDMDIKSINSGNDIRKHCDIKSEQDIKNRTTQNMGDTSISDSSESMATSEHEADVAISEKMNEERGCDMTPQVGTSSISSSSGSSRIAAQVPMAKEPLADSKSSSAENTSTSATWIKQPPINRLSVEFTEKAHEQMLKFSRNSIDPFYKLTFLDSPAAIKKSIHDILQADPRSTYRRTKCMDRLYFFIVDNCHVTCWFDETTAQVVRVQPAAFGHPDLGQKRAKLQVQ